MAKFNLDDYETVETRLEKFWEKYPNGRVYTWTDNKVNLGLGEVIIGASLYADRNDFQPFATGHAHESVANGPVNKTSHVENCETSAIGRALANGGFASRGKRPSREEMEKVQRAEQAKKPATPEQIEMVMIALDQIADINDMDELKNLYQGASEAGIAYISVEGMNIYTAVTNAKKRIEARNE